MRFVAIVILALIPCLRAEETPKSFPASWEGVWRGACVNLRDGKTVLRFPMELHVARKHGDSSLEVTYARRDDELDVTITTFGAQPVRTSGGEAKVAAYALRAVQRGTLKR